MATEKIKCTVSLPAAEDLDDYQYHFVVLDAGEVRLPNAATDIPFGVLQNAPLDGEEAVIAPMNAGNISKVVVGAAAVASGALVSMEYIAADDAGKAIAAVAASYPAGMVIEAGAAEDDLCSVFLASYNLQAA